MCRFARRGLGRVQGAGQIIDLRRQHRNGPPDTRLQIVEPAQPPRQDVTVKSRAQGTGNQQNIGNQIHSFPLQFNTNSMISRSLICPSPATICTRRSICARNLIKAVLSSRSAMLSARR